MKLTKIIAILMALITLTFISAYILPAAYTNADSGKNISRVVSYSTITDSSKITYICPMHPEVISDKPGQCPKCGMDLVLKQKEEKEQGMNCMDTEKCRQMGCNMDHCKGNSGGRNGQCPMMKEHNSNEHSGCKSNCCGNK
jgi:Heavy metal binding domain